MGCPSEFCKKPIICLTTGKQYSSTKEAADDLKMLPKRINDVLKGRKKSYNGHKFKYLEEILNTEPDKERARKYFRKKHTTAKKIACNETGKVYISITDAAKEYLNNKEYQEDEENKKISDAEGLLFILAKNSNILDKS